MTEVPLFPGFTDGTVRWRAESMQLVNWGGFEGHHQISFDPDTTLIAGPTGAGKSTILDAYTALMMPSRVPFNSASTDDMTGRARSAEQRSILSYLRGKLDMSLDATGTRVDQVLRGTDETVWGGIAMTFRADDDRRFSAIRVYLAAPSTTRDSDVVKRMFTFSGTVDLRVFDELRVPRFQARAVKAAIPGVESHEANYASFSDELFRKLGIAGGQKALELLARVQAGKQVRDVTALFTELVLERPQTYEMADRAIAHFGDLERLYEAIASDAEKQQLLEPMVVLRARYETALREVERLDTFGVRQAADQPFDLWATRYQLELCRQELDENRVARDAAQVMIDSTNTAVLERRGEQEQAERELHDSGGGAVARLKHDIDQAETTLKRVRRARGAFDTQTAILDVSPSTAESYAELRLAAAPFLKAFKGEQEALTDRIFTIRRDGDDAARERAELNQDLESFRQRDSLVPRRYVEARTRIAVACGIDAERLPFAAELIDLLPGCEEWRLAAEVTLRGVGLTMLMDARRQAQIRQQIDPVELGLRINFDGVDLADCDAEPEHPDYVSGRLQFKEDSPFVWWVKRRVYDEDHRCVDSAAELGGDERKVTRSGQTSRGTRGAHGRDRNQHSILGFSNEARCRELEQQIFELDTRITALATSFKALAAEADKLRAKQGAYQYVEEHRWEEIDVEVAEQRLDTLRNQLSALLASSEKLAELERLAVQARGRYEEAIAERTKVEERSKGLHQIWERLVADEDQLTGEQARLQSVTSLSDEVDAALSGRLIEQPDEARRYGPPLRNTLHMLRTTFRKELRHQETQIQDLAAQLMRIFKSYNERWPDPNRGEGMASYEQFDTIYTQIIGSGLAEHKNEFQRKVTDWAGRDLIQLQSEYHNATRAIERRLAPINETLSNLPYGAEKDRLVIAMRERREELVRVFLIELKGLTDRLTDDLTYEAAESRYQRLLEFMNKLRAGDNDGPSQRDKLLDVRRHIEITARRVDSSGKQLSVYTALSGKSGGESQELIAFIAGAALRFQLADDTESKPRFAPVFLDEGFVKADSEHAGRAVEAWRELGFQLILAVPLDKVTGLDRHIKLRLSVNKREHSSRVTELREHRDDRTA